MRDLFDLPELQAFVAVVESGSFTLAAQSLFLTQPTVSARIASLEASLNTKVLDRSPGHIRPTPAGEVLLPRARAILRDRAEAMREVDAFLGKLTGTLRIGASSIPGTYLLPRKLAELHEAFPQLRICLSVVDTEETLGMLRRGDIEAGMVGRPVDEEGIESKNVAQDEIVLVASPALAARHSPARGRTPLATGIPVILRESGSGTRAVVLTALEAAGSALQNLNVVLEIGGNAAAKEAALLGIGAVFLSRLAVREEISDGRLLLLPAGMAPIVRPLALVTKIGRTLSPGAIELVRLLSTNRDR